MVCSAMHRCQPATCAQPCDCTANFTCISDSHGMHCAPKPCTNDSDCSGYCVVGKCYAQIGTCDQAVP
jgi:hypothetical protein